jgi:hypothetical protein
MPNKLPQLCPISVKREMIRKQNYDGKWKDRKWRDEDLKKRTEGR